MKFIKWVSPYRQWGISSSFIWRLSTKVYWYWARRNVKLGLVTDWNSEAPWRNGYKARLYKAFLHYLPNFWPIWLFFQLERAVDDAAKLWKMIKYDKNLSKNEEKPCLTCHPSLNKKHTTLPFKISLWI